MTLITNPKDLPSAGRWQGRFNPALLFLLCLAAFPAWSGASWPADRGGPGKTGHRAGAVLTPPVSVMGEYHFGGLSAFHSNLLIDRQRVYTSATFDVWALGRIDSDPGEGFLVGNELEWSYTLDPDADEQILPSINRGTLLAGDMVIFTENLINMETLVLTSDVVGLDAETGAEVWRYNLGRTSAVGSPELLYHGGLFVRFTAEDDERNLNTFLMKIEPGAHEPIAMTLQGEGALLPLGDLGGMASSGGILHVAHRNQVDAYRMDTLEHLWVYIPQDTQHGEVAERSIREIASSGGSVYIGTTGHQIYSVGQNGDLRWVRDLESEEACHSYLYLLTDGEVLVASAFCDDHLFGIDMDTGGVLWHSRTDPQWVFFPPVLSGPYVLFPAQRSFSGHGLAVHDIYTGEEVQFLESASLPILRTLAVSDGLLFGLSAGVPGGQGVRVTVFEEEPAELQVAFSDRDTILPCGEYVGAEISVPLEYSNAGPGTARNASLRVRNHGGRVEFVLPPGTEATIHDDTIEFPLGDMEPSGPHTIDLRVIPQESWEVILTATATSDVRNPGGSGRDSIGFTVHDAPPPGFDLSIAAVEVTQGTQDIDNSVPLASKKTTLVRVYPESEVPMGGLEVLFEAAASPGESYETIPPLVPCISLPGGGFNRAELEESFNFLLPEKFLENRDDEPVRVRISLDPNERLDVADRSALTQTLELTFEPVAPICLLAFPVRTEDMNGEDLIPSTRIPSSIIRRAEALLPTPGIYVHPRNAVIERGLVNKNPYELDPGDTKSNHQVRAVSKLWLQRNTTDTPRHCSSIGASVHYLGVVGEDVYSSAPGRQFNGYANMPGSALLVRVVEPGAEEDFEFNDPGSGRTLAHELGHNFFRWHVDCGGPAGALSNIPYDPCTIGPVSDDAYFGTDLFTPTEPFVIPPRFSSATSQLADLMSYADERWTSDYTWRGVFDKLTPFSFLKSPEEGGRIAGMPSSKAAWLDAWKQETSRDILVYTLVNGEGEGEILQVLSLERDLIPAAKRVELAGSRIRGIELDSPYSYELFDDDDNVIESIPAEVMYGQDFGEETEIIAAIVPDAPGLAGIRLVGNGAGSLAERQRSSSPPEVTLLEPAGGAVADETIVVDWEASDPDGNELSTLIQYSHNDGDGWETIVTDVGEAPYEIDAEFLPGGVDTARIRVVVSDGFNTAHDTSNAFTLEPRQPGVTIETPSDGARFTHGTPVFLHAWAYDPEDGPLEGDALSWELDGQGVVGTGRETVLLNLPAGHHTITITGVDSDGNISADDITIEVLARRATPTEVIAVILDHMSSGEETQFDLNEDGVIDSADTQGP